jgi:hypothetical protein
MIIDNPIIFVKESPLLESMVFRFLYRSAAKEVELVYNYAAEVVSEHFKRRRAGLPDATNVINDFRRLIFYAVPSITCLGRAWPGFGLSAAELQSQGPRNPYQVITLMDIVGRGPEWFTATLKLQEYGPYTFHFTALDVMKRLGKAVANPDGKSWTYTDVQTGSVFDPLEPFESRTVK